MSDAVQAPDSPGTPESNGTPPQIDGPAAPAAPGAQTAASTTGPAAAPAAPIDGPAAPAAPGAQTAASATGPAAAPGPPAAPEAPAGPALPPGGAAPTESPPDPQLAAAAEVLRRTATVVIGQDEVLRQLLVTLLAGGHALLEGVPGTAKTLAVRALSLALDLRFGRVQFTPDLMPTDLVGVNVLEPATQRFVYRPGPVFTDLLLADEINRAPAKTQAALLEAMQERQVTVDGETRTLPAAFTVLATQNPVEYEGTYPLPEAQLDRFLLKIAVTYPDQAAERDILDRYAAGFHADRVDSFGIQPVLDGAGLAALRARVERVHVEPSVRDYITRIIRSTRDVPVFALGASPRAGVALFLATRASALIEGRDFVTPDDVKSLALPVLRHRVTLTPEAEIEGGGVDSHILQLLESVAAPRA